MKITAAQPLQEGVELVSEAGDPAKMEQGGEDHGEQREKFVVDLLLTLAKRLAQMSWR